jgi:hypothetical protein
MYGKKVASSTFNRFSDEENVLKCYKIRVLKFCFSPLGPLHVIRFVHRYTTVIKLCMPEQAVISALI